MLPAIAPTQREADGGKNTKEVASKPVAAAFTVQKKRWSCGRGLKYTALAPATMVAVRFSGRRKAREIREFIV
jgi:hypothetical protein